MLADNLRRVAENIGDLFEAGTVDSIAPPSPSGMVTMGYDALNRLSSRTDPSPGGTTNIGYDAHDRVTSVQDANGNTTANTYNGFGDRTQTASPDSGTTVATYDPDRNMKQKVLAGGQTANLTYDALDRNLTVAYVHREYTRDGKARFHRYVRENALHEDLTGVCDVLRCMRRYLNIR